MSNKKETDDFLLLMSGISDQKETINEMYINRVKQSIPYQLSQQLNTYTFISSKAKQLASDFRKINLHKETLPEIQKEYRKLEQYHESFQKLLNGSKNKINANQYDLDLISNEQLSNLRKSKPSLYLGITIVARNSSGSKAEAFRKYLKTHKEPVVLQEYESLRSSEMKTKDEQRGELFRYGGAVMGATLFIFLLKSFMPVSFQIEMGLIILALILLILGYRRVNEYVRFYSQSLLTVYIVGVVLLTLLQGFGKLPENFQFMQLRELHLLVLSGLMGGITGLIAGEKLNFIPTDKTFATPKFLLSIERRTRYFTISLLLFGSLWTVAFKENRNMYHFAEAKISQHLNEKQTVPAAAGEKGNPILGKLQVTSKKVNVRMEPDSNHNNNIVTVVSAGMVFDYYEVKEGSGGEWYRILEPNSQQMVWISGSTVAKQ